MNKSVQEMKTKEFIALNESTVNDQGGNEMINSKKVELTGVDNDGDKYYFKEKGKTIKELRTEKKEEEIEMTYKEFVQLDKHKMKEVLNSFRSTNGEVDNRPVPLLVKKQVHSMEFIETYEPEVSEEWELQQMRSRAEAEAKAGTGYKNKGGK